MGWQVPPLKQPQTTAERLEGHHWPPLADRILCVECVPSAELACAAHTQHGSHPHATRTLLSPRYPKANCCTSVTLRTRQFSFLPGKVWPLHALALSTSLGPCSDRSSSHDVGVLRKLPPSAVADQAGWEGQVRDITPAGLLLLLACSPHCSRDRAVFLQCLSLLCHAALSQVLPDPLPCRTVPLQPAHPGLCPSRSQRRGLLPLAAQPSGSPAPDSGESGVSLDLEEESGPVETVSEWLARHAQV